MASNRLKILYVDTDQVWRGGQEQLFTLMAGLQGRGHEVSLAAPPGSPLSARAAAHRIGVHPFRQRVEMSPAAFLRLRAILKAGQYDVIHFNTPRAVLSGGLSSRLCRVPLRVSSRRVNFPLRSPLSRFKYNWTQECVITVSFTIRQTLIEGGVAPDLVRVIYEGVDLAQIDALHPAETPAEGEVLVGTVAHLSREKGHQTLLAAARRVLKDSPGVRFLLVGEGDLEVALKRQARELGIADRIVFTGFRSDSEALMKQLDVFCLPSLSEGLSSAIQVAMASRLPVAATRVGGIVELVVDEETGLLVPPNDPEQLAAALARLIESPRLRARMGEAGRRRVEEHFTLERKLVETEALYLKLIGREAVG